MSIASLKGPLGQKTGKQPKKDKRRAQGKHDPQYLERVRSLPCIICETFGEAQLTPTTAHHWIDGRGSQSKTPDGEAIPLCDCHHQGLWLNSKTAKHKEPDKWRELYGLDTDYIKVTQARLA